MAVVFNPTNEDMSAFKGGIEHRFPAGCQIRHTDAVSNHILNNLGPRGLMKLEFGDDDAKVKKIAEAGIELNREFKTRQITSYNHNNEFNKQNGHPYLEPSKQIKAYAEELGYELFAPYTPDTAKEARIAALLTEKGEMAGQIEDQAGQIKALSDNMETMMEKMSAFMDGGKKDDKDAFVPVIDDPKSKKGKKDKDPKGD